jgi:hypothetical protein
MAPEASKNPVKVIFHSQIKENAEMGSGSGEQNDDRGNWGKFHEVGRLPYELIH